ncbi:MAG TPA: hypothetical protein VJI67_04210 [archaeon]|nr:hypothetical protein [archaeon]HLD80580.1 hypothetical protein [archaeon]
MSRFSCEECSASFSAKCGNCGLAVTERVYEEQRVLWCHTCKKIVPLPAHCGKPMKFVS